MAPRINLPPLTRGLLLTLTLLSTLNATLRFRRWSASLDSTPSAGDAANYLTSPEWAIPYLVLIPSAAWKYPWTFVTAALVENNLLAFGISGAVIWFGGRYLERAWGSREFGGFFVVVTVVPNCFAFFIYSLWGGFGGDDVIFPTPIQGLIAAEAGFLVALKQLVPEHTVSLFKSLLRIRIKHFPALFVAANIVSGPLLGTDTALWLSLTGFLTSWIYLRFYRVSEITGAATGGEGARMRGDASETFSFVSFFPEVLHPFLAPVSDSVWQIMLALKVCMPFSDEAIDAGIENAASRSEGGLPVVHGRGGSGQGRRAEAERRRALALKALDQRLSAAAAGRGGDQGQSQGVTNVVPVVDGGVEAEGKGSTSAGAVEDGPGQV